ncbi:MAG: GyrI-like domain-containing protein [Eggerthella lenta]
MHYEIVELPARTIVGPTVRTSNNSPEETTVIGQLWQRFMGEGLDRTISEVRVVPYGCFALYYGYDMSDMSYELLVGCETPAEAPEGMEAQTIAAGRYAKIAIRGGDCVTSVQKAWRRSGPTRSWRSARSPWTSRRTCPARTCPAPTSTCS